MNYGHVPCNNCTEFTHVLSARVIAALPDDYHGELCPKCKLWMCRLDKINESKLKANGDVNEPNR